MTNSKQVGDSYEATALKHLLSKKLILIMQNYRTPFGEIDLIMKDQSVLAFIEVRFRKNASFGGAISSVTANKQNKIRKTAQQFLIDNKKYQSYTCRFDVIAISKNLKENEINWITSAFI